MKRSDMLKSIDEMIGFLQDVDDDYENGLSENILGLVEELGMLPPTSYLKVKDGEGYDVPHWEPEYED